MNDGGAEAVWTPKQITEGEWAGWQIWSPDPYELLSGPFYARRDEAGRMVCAFRAERKHMNGHDNMHGGGAVARLGPGNRNGNLNRFDQKIYLAIYYLGQKDLQGDLAAPDGVLERLKRKISREDLYSTWLYNWHSNSPNGSAPDLSQWNKPKLWDYLVSQNLLRVMIVVAGAGPHASGMPELQLAMNASSHPLNGTAVLVTDGRVAFHHDGISIAHVVPEALDGGGLAAVRTGDWIYLDLSKGEFQAVTHTTRGYKVIGVKELASRSDRKKRINELERRRLELMPSFRILLDQVSSAEAGVSPAHKTN